MKCVESASTQIGYSVHRVAQQDVGMFLVEFLEWSFKNIASRHHTLRSLFNSKIYNDLKIK